MSTNITKKNRVNEVAALQKLADGFTKHAATAPSVVLAGVTLKPSDIVAKLQARLALATAVQTAAANWHGAIQNEQTAAAGIKPLLSVITQVLRGAYSTQLDVLGDFGVAPRKQAVVSPETRVAAALKAKATRVARGTKGTVQKAAITAPVSITPATATPVKVVSATSAVTPAATPASPPAPGASAPPTTAPASASPAPASPPAPAAHS